MSVQLVISWIFFVLSIIFAIAAPLSLIAFRWREGFWGNLLCAMNMSFASLFALDYFEVLAAMLTQLWAGGLFFYDFLCFWLIFAFTFFILNLCTNRLSTIKVHFPALVEKISNGCSLLCIVAIFASSVFFSLPSAPLPPKEDGVESEARMSEFLGLKARILSHGTLAPFSGDLEWTAAEDYVYGQMEKRWLIKTTADKEGTFVHSGETPPVITQFNVN
ncbi:MAG: hypothetical protein ACRC10_07870 [Thermoguttaceae bacterium]